MQDQNRIAARRILLIVLTALIVGVAIWALFFRPDTIKDTKEPKKSPETATSQKQPADEQNAPVPGSTSPSASGASGAEKGANPPPSSPPQNSTNQPRQLADTGSGDVFLIALGTAVVSASLHAVYSKRNPYKTRKTAA